MQALLGSRVLDVGDRLQTVNAPSAHRRLKWRPMKHEYWSKQSEIERPRRRCPTSPMRRGDDDAHKLTERLCLGA